MGLASFLQRKNTPAPAGDAADAVQQARTKARRRLIGAVVLLGIGVIGFPLLFETQPRPIPVDIPIEIPRKDHAPPLAMPVPRAAAPAAPPAVITEKAGDAGREVAATPEREVRAPEVPAVKASAAPGRESAREAKSDNSAKSDSAMKSDSAAKTDAAVKAESPPRRDAPAAAKAEAMAKPAPKADSDGARAKALLEGQPVAAADAKTDKTDKSDAARYIVQVGAFADPGTARDARLKVERLGLKTYTQVVDTDAGKRIRVRVGPFASRDEADKAAAKLKSGGLASAVLTL